MDFTMQNWRYAVFHPVWRCDSDNTNARPITCTEWLQFCIANNVRPGDFYQSGHGYGAGITYNEGCIIERGDDGATYGNGQSWVSLAGSNIGHDPLTSPTWWETIDDGLGAENASFANITGISPLTRTLGGKVSYHLYTSANGVNAIRLTDQYTQGQFSMGLGSPLPCLAVRMSSSSDSCYYGQIEIDEFEYITTTLYKVVNGIVTQIGTTGEYNNGYDLNRQRVYAVGNKIGVDVPAGTGNYIDDPIAGATYHTLLEVTDATLPAATYPYVGVRIDANAGTYLMHEYAGGGFEGPVEVSLSSGDINLAASPLASNFTRYVPAAIGSSDIAGAGTPLTSTFSRYMAASLGQGNVLSGGVPLVADFSQPVLSTALYQLKGRNGAVYPFYIKTA